MHTKTKMAQQEQEKNPIKPPATKTEQKGLMVINRKHILSEVIYSLKV